MGTIQIIHQPGERKDQLGVSSLARRARYGQSPLGIPRIPAGGLVTPDRERLVKYELAKTVLHLPFLLIRLQT